jgi:hypothetical protein
MRKILILGGMHGNERLGVRLVRSLQQNPLTGVDVMIANPRAVVAGARFIESDLNRSFGEQKNETYEVRRAREIQQKAADYDIVLDFHNTQTPGNNCSFVGDACSPLLYDVAKMLGFATCIEATYDCVNKYCPNTISMEVSIGDALDDVAVWRQKIASLREVPSLVTIKPLVLYRFKQRVTWDEKEKYGFDAWRPFVAISNKDKAQLNVIGDFAPIFVGSRLTEYYATLLSKERTV